MTIDILKKDIKTGEILEKICFVDGDKVKYELANIEDISDGYHTFSELYEHRIALFIAFCFCSKKNCDRLVWRSKKHSDNSSFKEWFIMGIGEEKGKQITYHLPLKKWNDCDFAQTLDKAPEFDGHTSADVLKRLKNL
jgi:hypothetical protein